MKKGYTEIAVVLDRSGSMSSVADDTIGGFNTFIEEQKKVPGYVAVTLAQFDDVYEIVYSATALEQVKPLDSYTFRPRGYTALHDAIGKTINDLGTRFSKMSEDERPEAVIFVIITDGMENASHEFRGTAIKKMVEHQKTKYSWQFLFLGANQDAVLAGESIGVSSAHSMTYASNSVGTKGAFGAIARSANSYRAAVAGGSSLYSASVGASFTDEEREEQLKAGTWDPNKPKTTTP